MFLLFFFLFTRPEQNFSIFYLLDNIVRRAAITPVRAMGFAGQVVYYYYEIRGKISFAFCEKNNICAKTQVTTRRYYRPTDRP